MALNNNFLDALFFLVPAIGGFTYNFHVYRRYKNTKQMTISLPQSPDIKGGRAWYFLILTSALYMILGLIGLTTIISS